MSDHRFAADLTLTINSATVECAATVFFSHCKGFEGDRTDPPEPATVELTEVQVRLPGRDSFKLPQSVMLDALNDALQNEMFEFVAAEAEDAAERRGESRRDDLLMERF